MHQFFIYVIIVVLTTESLSQNSSKQNTLDNDSSEWNCHELDFCDDKLGFEAIKWLHHQLDDDANGNVDITESDEFLREELQYENANDKHRNFHGNDKHISVDELWKSWKISEVHNWTVDETLDWLSASLELPQYVDNFLSHKVDGTALPRLANHQFISQLGIKDPIHRQKISLKAMDVVLFGPPKMHNYMKDIILVISCIIAIGGLWHAIITNRYSRKHLKKMLKDMDSLQKAEEQLQELQKELDKAKEEQQLVTLEKAHLEERLNSEIGSRSNNYPPTREGSLPNFSDFNRISELEEELRCCKQELARVLENKSWTPPYQLQLWLQLTHEIESQHYNAKRQAAEMQLLSAKEGCEKLKKKRSSFLGSFKVAHGSSIDDVDNRILLAKTALSDITRDLKERLYRWQQIEQLCNFSIVNNPGFPHIQAELCYPKNSAAASDGPSLTRNNSDNAIQEIESDSYDFSKSTNRVNVVSRSGKSTLSSDVSSLISLPSASTSLHHRNQLTTDQVQVNGDESHSEGESNVGEDNDSKSNRPQFSIGDCPTIPENSKSVTSSSSSMKRPFVRQQSTISNKDEPLPILANGKSESILRHRTSTVIENVSFNGSNHLNNGHGNRDDLKNDQLVSKQLNQSNQQSSSAGNLEDKSYSSGSETPPTKKKASRKGIKFLNKLRKRKSLPEKDFTAVIKSLN